MHTVDTKPFFCGCGCGLPGNEASQTLVKHLQLQLHTPLWICQTMITGPQLAYAKVNAGKQQWSQCYTAHSGLDQTPG